MFDVTEKVKNKYSGENQMHHEEMIQGTMASKDYVFTKEKGQRFVTQNATAKLGDQEMTAQQVWGQAFLDQYKNYFSENIYNSKNALDYEKVTKQTELSKDKIDQLREYSKANAGRSNKRRQHHVQRTNHYAKELSEKKNELLNTSHDFIQMRGQYNSGANNDNFPEKDYAKLCEKKLKLELQLIEDNYKLELHALKIEGNRDDGENKQLDEIKKVSLAKKIGCLKNMKEEAQKHPKYISEKDLDKQIQTLEKEFFQLNANEQLTDEEKLQRSKKLSAVETKIKRRMNQQQEKVEKEQRTQFYLDNYKNEIEATKSSLLSEGPAEELTWRKEIVTDRWIAEAQAQVAANANFVKSNPDLVLDNVFIFKANCLKALYFQKTDLSFTDQKKLTNIGVTDGGLDRTVRSQMKPVRRLKDGSFAGKVDEENEQWNRKWIDSYYTNDMTARKECIAENMDFLLNSKIRSDIITTPEALLDNYDEYTRHQRILLCQSNLKSKDEFTKDATCTDNSEIYKEVFNEKCRTEKIEGFDYDSIDSLTDDFACITELFEDVKAFNVSDGKIMPKSNGPEYREYLKTKINAFNAAGNK